MGYVVWGVCVAWLTTAHAADPLRAREAALGVPYDEPPLAAVVRPAAAPPAAEQAAKDPAPPAPTKAVTARAKVQAKVAAAPDPEEEARLKAIREALVLAAAQGPTRVVADAWLDDKGALREDTRMTSEVRVRGVRVRSYLQGNDQRRWQAEVDAAAIDPRLTVEALAKRKACPVPSEARWAHHVGWHLELAPAAASVWDYFGQQALAAARQPWQQASGARWVATPAAPAAESAYQRMLLGQGGPGAPWQLHMVLQASAAPNNAVRLQLRAQLVAAPNRAQVWRAQAEVMWPLGQAGLSAPTLPEAVTRELAQLAQRWQQALGERLACEPLHFALHREGGALMLHAGEPSGLRQGDRVVLVNKHDIPAQVLHAGVVSRLALAKVESIEGQRSTLRQVAGPPVPTQGDWVALPL
jgi:hypothetical protein